jgi:hypothetical protein
VNRRGFLAACVLAGARWGCAGAGEGEAPAVDAAFDLRYPAPPYGYAPGDVLANLVFRGELVPGQAGGVGLLDYATIRAAALRDGVHVALVWNVAGWCRANYEAMRVAVARWQTDGVRARGGLFLSLLDSGPVAADGAFGTEPSTYAGPQPDATDEDLRRWNGELGISFVSVHDGFDSTPHDVVGQPPPVGYGLAHRPFVVDLVSMRFLANTDEWPERASTDDLISRFESDYLDARRS